MIPTHPRLIPSLVRRPDDGRKAKRVALAERKADEKRQKDEAIRRSKGERRREVEVLLAGLKKELGNKVDWQEVDQVLDGEWDEEEWERIIGAILSTARENEVRYIISILNCFSNFTSRMRRKNCPYGNMIVETRWAAWKFKTMAISPNLTG